MPVFDKSAWTLNQPVVIARRGRQGIATSPATIVKIGRSWVTVRCNTSHYEERYDFTGRQDGDIGWRAQLWPSQKAFDQEQARRKAWYRLKNAIAHDPPEHLTTDDIDSIFAQVSPES